MMKTFKVAIGAHLRGLQIFWGTHNLNQNKIFYAIVTYKHECSW